MRPPAPPYSRRQLLRDSLALAGLGLLAGCQLPRLPWQQPVGPSRIGYLGLRTEDSGENLEAFRDALRELGYAQGRTIVIEERWAGSADRFPNLAAELAGLLVDVIVTAGGAPAARAAMGATRTIPIVFTGAGDPVQAGLVASLARPGGNVTGPSDFGAPLGRKRLELLREMVPSVSRVLFLTDAVGAQGTGGLQATEEAARALGVQLVTPAIRGVADLPAAFEMGALERAEAVLVGGSALLRVELGRLVGYATAARLPLMAQDRAFAAAGGLGAYGANRAALYRRAAAYVDRILKGASPADLPVEQPTTFDLIINLKTAQALGLTIPQSVLQQATEIIQ